MPMSSHSFWVRRSTIELILPNSETEFSIGVAMSCVIGRGYFKEVGKFGSCVYKNNELSQVLCKDNPSSLKSAIGFLSVFILSFYRV
jgi:hypothetical protein